jgi:hypothetical protein
MACNFRIVTMWTKPKGHGPPDPGLSYGGEEDHVERWRGRGSPLKKPEFE